MGLSLAEPLIDLPCERSSKSAKPETAKGKKLLMNKFPFRKYLFDFLFHLRSSSTWKMCEAFAFPTNIYLAKGDKFLCSSDFNSNYIKSWEQWRLHIFLADDFSRNLFKSIEGSIIVVIKSWKFVTQSLNTRMLRSFSLVF